MILQGFRNASHYESQTVLQQGADDEKTEKSVAWCAVFVLWIFGALLLLKIWNFQELLPDPGIHLLEHPEGAFDHPLSES